ncbi:hypothetical protein HanRHA438_Chr08g0334551 [Helianthus annuus]|nr:hypothetical protein HanRHA438_Chr08g0334551 [Helianthus annuus]
MYRSTESARYGESTQHTSTVSNQHRTESTHPGNGSVQFGTGSVSVTGTIASSVIPTPKPSIQTSQNQIT